MVIGLFERRTNNYIFKRLIDQLFWKFNVTAEQNRITTEYVVNRPRGKTHETARACRIQTKFDHPISRNG